MMYLKVETEMRTQFMLRIQCNKSQILKEDDMVDLDLIKIAESFNKWLTETAEQYGIDKDDLQEIIKSFIS